MSHTKTDPSGRSTAWRVGAAVGLVLIVSVVVAARLTVLSAGVDSLPVADQSPLDLARGGDPEEVARVWIEAFWSGDLDTMLAFMDDSRAYVRFESEGVSAWSVYFDTVRGGHRFALEGCEFNGSRHECTVTSLGSHRLYGLSDGDVFQFFFTIEDSTILSVDMRNLFANVNTVAIHDVMEDAYGDDYQRICRPSAFILFSRAPDAECTEMVVEAYGLEQSEG